MKKLNLTHIALGFAAGAVLIHLYHTKTTGPGTVVASQRRGG